jgi:transposase
VDRSAQVKNELQEALESANIKLARVATDITGVSAMEMLAGLLEGRATAEELAELARGRMRAKKTQLAAALEGQLQPHHRLIVSQLLADLAWCEEQIAEVTAEIARRLANEEQTLERLDEIPGVNRRIAEIIIAEAGSDMSRFPTEGQFVAWSGYCPGNNQSGGRRRHGRTRPGNRSLKRAIAEAAHAAGRKKGSFFQARYQRLAKRRGKKRAKVAVGHSLLKAVYHMLSRGTHYEELGEDYYDRRDPAQAAQKLARKIEKLGFRVDLTPLTSRA